MNGVGKVNTTKLIIGLIITVLVIVLMLITINTSLSIVDKNGCFRHGIITKKDYVCSTFEDKYRKLVLQYCPGRFKQLLEQSYCINKAG